MPGAHGNLRGSGPQQAYVWLSYVSYDAASNRSTWYYEAIYKGGWGSWSGSTQSWSLSGFATASGTFTIPSPGTGDIVSAQGPVRDGWVRATLERSISPAGPSSRNRRHHRHAVVREMPISAATCATARPDWMRWTRINLPAGASRALPWDRRGLRVNELRN